MHTKFASIVTLLDGTEVTCSITVPEAKTSLDDMELTEVTQMGVNQMVTILNRQAFVRLRREQNDDLKTEGGF